MMSTPSLNQILMNVVWTTLQQDFDKACMMWGINREIGDLILGMQFGDILALSNAHSKLPLFEVRNKDSTVFWRTAIENASKDSDSQWSKVVRHHALLMAGPSPDRDGDAHKKTVKAPLSSVR